MGTVRYAAVDGVATITLDRPASLNSLTPEVMRDLTDALARVETDESVRVIVLTGEGRGFCSGADLSASSIPPPGAAPAPPSPTAMDDTAALYNGAMVAIAEAPVPTIARVQGVAAGGGVGLALACDITIAARSASFVCTFGPRLGIVPDLGVTWHLPRRIGRSRALGLAMLGGRLSAEQAAEWGLIWSVVDDDALDREVAAVAAQLARSSPVAMTRIRAAIDGGATAGYAEQMDVEMAHQAVLIPMNMAEGAAAFRERRDPHFDGRRTAP